ncbi:Receptor-type tyrosine-protein phosphatase U [Liparis tanakae]|uniref:Receptor-type tyrosine-protein phosphatase U n=1 Tax=Liparis tanakae TaxID=230148 RepID=A0A4Z2IEQ1_9TELE|nr:Receptor-type tyrosine-protein phosphatase U [Liparis tanakae]
MKTAEGYGFKQEYESFFDGWDSTKKKDKTKGRHDTLGYDRHRVKLHPLLGDPNSDYINANYIDVSLIRLFCLCSTWETNSRPLLSLSLSHPAKPQSISLIPVSSPVCWPTFTWKLSSNQTSFLLIFSPSCHDCQSLHRIPDPDHLCYCFLLKQSGMNASNTLQRR